MDPLLIMPTIDALEVMQLPVGSTDIGILQDMLAKWSKMHPFQRDKPEFVRLATKIDYLSALILSMQQEQPDLQPLGRQKLEEAYNALMQQKVAAESPSA